MTPSSSLALFFALALSAAIPGPSVLAVVSRSLSSGMAQGVLVVVGVIIADILLISLALLGLTTLASLLGEFAAILKYIGASYLIWMAWKVWHSNPNTEQSGAEGIGSSVLTGLVMTLSNPKAILFYMGFLPAFVDLSSLTIVDSATIYVLSMFAVGGVLTLYAGFASTMREHVKNSRSSRWLSKLSSGTFASCGVLLVVKQ
ncbi:LysE family translocator [Vibrio variabilis]|uniref:LysE family translocator n=1 Tax=Vibrio variabilis TaxID=990271 RepID=UPI000DD6D8A0|nr:LysE family translocator [Vibrio variabilis]